MVTISIFVFTFFQELPEFEKFDFSDLKKVAQIEVSKKIKDKSRRYRWVSIDEVSRDYLYAIVMSEDAGFFEHSGIEIDSILDSMAENLRKRQIEAGGSTISQQVVKNLFLSNERTLTRKIKEIFITRRLEMRFKKNEILEVYLNIAPLGPNIIGVNAAAQKYFKRTPAEIHAGQAAFIALMLPSPRRMHYSLIENKNLTRAHRNKMRRILSDLLQNDYISYKQYQEYLNFDPFGEIIADYKQRGGVRRSPADKRR